ncbi:related to transcription activator amyR [Cephalotrichum gorgonifer]|uniref:Related to transcription activator amyR n=1 Tax=Cephalotrichum gorgonifer TaxID=2041049 RepID=A0AAE8SSH9_9PEZI|nr:related to transcription activator amyR [Cephalotrichum gorgonifer]
MSNAAVKRACDACHRRKVKCDGVSPCRNCSTAQLTCTYNAVPQKKGPKGSRAKVISELRETQRQTSLYARIQNRVTGLTQGPSQNPVTAGPSPGMVTSELVKECTEFFFANLYDTIPVLSRQKLEQESVFMEQSRDAYCLATTLCALVMLQPGMNMPASDPYNLDMMACSNMVASQLLLEEAMRVRVGYEYFVSPTLNSIVTSYLFFACYHATEVHDRAWFYLREASTMMQMAGMHKEETYMEWDPVEASRRRRLYWLLFSTERAYAIQRQRPVTLQATINLPSMADDPSDPQAHQLQPFLSLVSTFRHFDDSLIATWNKTSAQFTQTYTKGLDKQLNEAVPTYLCRDPQFSDLATCQSWLRNTHWQLTSQGDDGITFPFPAEMARNMVMNWAAHFPGQGVHLVGSGLIEKLFEVSNDTAAALAHKPASRVPYTLGLRERLDHLLNAVGALRNGDERFMPLLFHMLSEALPRLISPVLQNAPEAVAANLANIDLFDGFGNAGMAQPPPQMGFSLEGEQFAMGDYEKKYSPAEYDRKFSMPSVSGNSPDSRGGDTSNGSLPPHGTPPDMAPTSYGTSPPLMSPGSDFSQGGVNDFTAFPDMMMSRMGQNNPASGMNGQTPHQGHCPMPNIQGQNLGQMHGQNLGGQMHGSGPPQCQPQPPTGQVNAHNLANRAPGTPQQGMPQQGMMGHQNKGMPGQMHMMQGMNPGGNMAVQLQRSGSFAHPGQAMPRTVGDYNILQRPYV